jgi:hypothetical protein
MESLELMVLLQILKKEKNISMQGKNITLKGTLLYNDGKLLMQIDENDKPLLTLLKIKRQTLHQKQKKLGTLDVKGEIVDPNCFFWCDETGRR